MFISDAAVVINKFFIVLIILFIENGFINWIIFEVYCKYIWGWKSKISLPKDSKIVDLIVESNFRYFSNIALYFPKTDMILVPTCHTEIIVYTPSSKDVITMIETVIERYADDECNIVCKNSNDTKYEFCD